MGRLGCHLATKMQELGNDVMVIDENPAIIESLSSVYTDTSIGDCTNEAVIQSLGVNNFDICFVTIGNDFESSIVITSLLKSNGAKLVVSKAKTDIQADLLRKIGADEVVYPEREVAEKLAVRFNAKNIFDFIKLTSEYYICEIPVASSWIGYTLKDLNIRKKYGINVIAVKNENEINPAPSPDYVFRNGEHVIVIGKTSDVFKLTAKT